MYIMDNNSNEYVIISKEKFLPWKYFTRGQDKVFPNDDHCPVDSVPDDMK